jgi:hypothetical protein
LAGQIVGAFKGAIVLCGDRTNPLWHDIRRPCQTQLMMLRILQETQWLKQILRPRPIDRMISSRF